MSVDTESTTDGSIAEIAGAPEGSQVVSIEEINGLYAVAMSVPRAALRAETQESAPAEPNFTLYNKSNSYESNSYASLVPHEQVDRTLDSVKKAAVKATPTAGKPLIAQNTLDQIKHIQQLLKKGDGLSEAFSLLQKNDQAFRQVLPFLAKEDEIALKKLLEQATRYEPRPGSSSPKAKNSNEIGGYETKMYYVRGDNARKLENIIADPQNAEFMREKEIKATEDKDSRIRMGATPVMDNYLPKNGNHLELRVLFAGISDTPKPSGDIAAEKENEDKAAAQRASMKRWKDNEHRNEMGLNGPRFPGPVN